MNWFTPDNHCERSNYTAPVLSEDAGGTCPGNSSASDLLHPPEPPAHLLPFSLLETFLFRFCQDYWSSLPLPEGESEHPTEWHNHILTFWWWSRKKNWPIQVSQLFPMAQNLEFWFLCKSLSSWYHSQDREPTACTERMKAANLTRIGMGIRERLHNKHFLSARTIGSTESWRQGRGSPNHPLAPLHH